MGVNEMKSNIKKLIGLFFMITVISATLVRAQELDETGKLKGKWDFITKCGKCHSLERPLTRIKTAEQWEVTVKAMHGKAHGWIEDKQVKEIIWFLTSKSIYETKCTGCHSEYRALDLIKNKEEWTKTVKTMQQKPNSNISDEDADRIIIYLFTIQGGE